MSASEAAIQAEILRECCRGPTRLFRNTVGVGWVGRVIRQEDGLVVLTNARRQTFGLVPGSGDLIGWHGARFLSVEVKSRAGSPSAEQRQWMAAVQRAGGLAGIARSVEDVARLLGEGVIV
jgi:hypothetical protein